jgi:carbon monoxide dehydrogenase subunit G
MEMSSSRIIGAPPQAVWEALNDPDVLKDCIPGCETLTRESDTDWRAVIAAKVGPVSARFSGKVELADVTPPTGYTLKFEGQGGAAGFANGEAKVTLAPAAENQTELSYVAKAQVGGKLAQIGSRLVDGVAAKMADDFFARFAARFAPEPAISPVAEAAAATRAPRGGSHWVRYVALVAIVVLLVILATRGFR